MEKKYENYSVEDFTQDIDFINWVQNGTNHEKWEKFVLANSQLSRKIDTAKKIIVSLRFKEREIDGKSMSSVYKNVEQYYEGYNKAAVKIRIIKFMRYAAIIVLCISIALAIPFYYHVRDNMQLSELNVLNDDFKDAKLTLSNGEEIVLTNTHTDLQFNASGDKVKIDKDSTISSNSSTDPNAMAQVVIPFGMRSDILLSDGTKVWLNAGSKLIFPQKFSGKYRKVFLKGEAYFDVIKNKDVPFIVSTEDINVTVLGTEFNMRNNESDNELEVTLVEGLVSLKENKAMSFMSKEVKLKPYQKATFNKSDRNTTVESNVDVSYYISWKEGMLEFNRESILNVFKKLSEFYHVDFVTESSVETNKKISGKLDLKDSLEEVMKVVSDAAPITFRINGDKVTVNSKIKLLPKR